MSQKLWNFLAAETIYISLPDVVTGKIILRAAFYLRAFDKS